MFTFTVLCKTLTAKNLSIVIQNFNDLSSTVVVLQYCSTSALCKSSGRKNADALTLGVRLTISKHQVTEIKEDQILKNFESFADTS